MQSDDPKSGGTENDKNAGAGAAAASPSKQDEHVAEAHEQAEADIEQDPDLSIHSPNDDLDEGELARLGDDENGIV